MIKVVCISGKAEHGKTTMAEAIKGEAEKTGAKVLLINYADYLKYIAITYFGWDGKKDEAGRSLLQLIGTMAREVDMNYWVKIVHDFIKTFGRRFDLALIADCRYPNEIEYMQTNGLDITSLRVVRLNFTSSLTPEQLEHPSETALDDYLFDHYIKCESGIENVQREAESFLERLYNE